MMRVKMELNPIKELDKGHMDLLIKVYMPSADFPLGGKMSQYIENLKIGETLDFTGPKGRLEYKGCGSFKIDGIKKSDPTRDIDHVTEIGMIAGGSGITPMWQIIQDVFQNCQNDKTKIHLLFANKTEGDILLHSGKIFSMVQKGRFYFENNLFDHIFDYGRFSKIVSLRPFLSDCRLLWKTDGFPWHRMIISVKMIYF